ncbi:MAG TPA: SRPBCC family protein [Candidatus Limnocylindria bacterium]|nr:SRPBCC family protein [Candidatus Limnocylindria bacterium]
MRVESSILIGADRRAVWDFIALPENGPRWQEGAASTRVTTPGPVRLGTEMDHVGRWLGISFPTRATVTVFEPPAAFGYDIASAMAPSPAQMRYRLEAVDGGTRLTLSNEATLMAPMRPFERLLRRNVQAMFDRDVRRLRDVLEARSSAVASR